MFKENLFVFFEVLPPSRKRGQGGEVYRPKEYKTTLSGKLEKIDKQLNQQEAQKVLERLNEIGEVKCPKCSSKLVSEDDSDSEVYKFMCLDCGYKWVIKK